ncbi:MAG: hypothetical protein WKF43_10410 [Acidimicrobiales bacterium]
MPVPPTAPVLAVVDAGMISGWRRAKPSLDQLADALDDLRSAHPDVEVAVVGDPALKHALPKSSQGRLETDIGQGIIVLAPAGTLTGFHGFLAEIVRRAAMAGLRPVVVTDQLVPGAALGRVRQDDGTWVFDLEGTKAGTGAGFAPTTGLSRGRRGRRPVTRASQPEEPAPVAGARARADVAPEHQSLLDAIGQELARCDPRGTVARLLDDPAAAARAAVRAVLASVGP